jgi:hypothetical protein
MRPPSLIPRRGSGPASASIVEPHHGVLGLCAAHTGP